MTTCPPSLTKCVSCRVSTYSLSSLTSGYGRHCDVLCALGYQTGQPLCVTSTHSLWVDPTSGYWWYHLELDCCITRIICCDYYSVSLACQHPLIRCLSEGVGINSFLSEPTPLFLSLPGNLTFTSAADLLCNNLLWAMQKLRLNPSFIRELPIFKLTANSCLKNDVITSALCSLKQ